MIKEYIRLVHSKKSEPTYDYSHGSALLFKNIFEKQFYLINPIYASDLLGTVMVPFFSCL